MSEVPQLHVSGLNTISFCGEQYRRLYVEGERIPPGVSALVGRATDKAVTLNLGHKIKTQQLAQIDAVEAAARDTLDHEWATDGVLLQPDEATEGAAKVKGRAIDKAVRLSRLHAITLAPTINATAVQRELVADLNLGKMRESDPGLPERIQLAATEDIEEGDAIRDTKTTGKTPSAGVAEESTQLTTYALMRRVIDGLKVVPVKLDYLIDLKTPKAAVYESSRTEADYPPLLRRIAMALRAIRAGAFVPVKQNDPMCSPKYCGFYGSCPYVRRPVSVALPHVVTAATGPTLLDQLEASIAAKAAQLNA